MRVAKALLIVGCAGALTAWLVAAAAPRQASAPPARTAARPVRTAAPTGPMRPAIADDRFALETDRLHRALTSMPTRGSAARDLFRFGRGQGGGPAHTPGIDGNAVAAEDAGEPLAPAEVTRLPLELLGIAEDAAPAGELPVRTAVLSSAQQLYLVKAGEQLALRFLVTAIERDSVELKDLADDSVFRLTLR